MFNISSSPPLLLLLLPSLQAVFPCLVELWESPQLVQLNPKVVELLIATIKHLYSNERLIQTKLADFFKLNAPPGASAISKSTSKSTPVSEAVGSSSTPSGDSAPPPPPPPPPTHPSVDPTLLQQLSDMGFSRDHAEEALIASANDLTSAMDWILNHPQPTTAAAAVSPSSANPHIQ